MTRTWSVQVVDEYDAPIKWRSNDGIRIERVSGSTFKAYDRDGSRIIDCEIFDSAALVRMRAGELVDGRKPPKPPEVKYRFGLRERNSGWSVFAPYLVDNELSDHGVIVFVGDLPSCQKVRDGLNRVLG